MKPREILSTLYNHNGSVDGLHFGIGGVGMEDAPHLIATEFCKPLFYYRNSVYLFTGNGSEYIARWRSGLNSYGWYLKDPEVDEFPLCIGYRNQTICVEIGLQKNTQSLLTSTCQIIVYMALERGSNRRLLSDRVFDRAERRRCRILRTIYSDLPYDPSSFTVVPHDELQAVILDIQQVACFSGPSEEFLEDLDNAEYAIRRHEHLSRARLAGVSDRIRSTNLDLERRFISQNTRSVDELLNQLLASPLVVSDDLKADWDWVQGSITDVEHPRHRDNRPPAPVVDYPIIG